VRILRFGEFWNAVELTKAAVLKLLM
jgi:hypothetical protein